MKIYIYPVSIETSYNLKSLYQLNSEAPSREEIQRHIDQLNEHITKYGTEIPLESWILYTSCGENLYKFKDVRFATIGTPENYLEEVVSERILKYNLNTQ